MQRKIATIGIINLFLMLTFSLSTTVHAEDVLTRKSTWLPNRGQEQIFYKNNKEVARKELDQSGHIIKNEGEIPDGVFKDDTWHREISYKNGLENGSMKTYREDGILSFEHEMKDGKPIRLKAYFPDGKIRSEAAFNEDGTYVEKIYDQSGQVIKINNHKK